MVSTLPEWWDVEGPIPAEVFVVCLRGDQLELTGPCGAAPWMIELGTADHPVEVVDRIVRDVIGPPTLVHSTSWRRDRDAVILSFVVVIEETQLGGMQSVPIGRSEIARSEATAAPREIRYDQVVEHGLRHLAWLASDDPVVRAELPDAWQAALASYVPRALPGFGMTMDEGIWRAGCACGWETTGPIDDVVQAVQEHARRVHNMEATRDQVLAGAQPRDPGAASSSGGRSDRNRTQSARS